MQHLDEGTVHAWLDGELSEPESAAAAQHVAECAECAALVAEARGLIAGASRVVSALDAGPSGVIPRAQPANGMGFWRRLTRSPSRMAMAATILVAVGVTLTVRRAPHDSTSPKPATVETAAVVSAPATPPANAAGAPASPAQASSVAAELKDRAARAPSNKPASAVAPTPSVGDQAAFVAGARKQSPTIAGGSADNALADKKKDVAMRRDRPEPAAPPLDMERAKAADSVAARSLAPAVRRLEATASAGQMREAAAQPPNSRAAALDAMNEVSLQGCYRLSVDTSEWRGVLPASFVLAGPAAQAQRVAGGQARQAAPVSSNTVQGFAQKAELAGFGVHAIGANGQADSTLIGDWTTVGPTTARVRFLTANQPRLVSVLISTGSPIARVAAGDRTDSLRVTRIVCPR